MSGPWCRRASPADRALLLLLDRSRLCLLLRSQLPHEAHVAPLEFESGAGAGGDLRGERLLGAGMEARPFRLADNRAREWLSTERERRRNRLPIDDADAASVMTIS